MRSRALAVALVLALLVFLFLQPGLLGPGIHDDEAEHLHAAWLIAARGLKPIHGFFEHHLPLLWYALGAGYKLGIHGPEAVYWGRLVVVALGAGLWMGALFAVVRRGPRRITFGVLSLSAFASVAIFAQDMLVIRPETLALGLCGAALWIWLARRGPLAALVSGALFAAAAFSSPRFALLLPAFVFAEADEPRLPAAVRSGAFVAGAVAASAALLATIVPLPDLLFDLRFSSLLQEVGLRLVGVRYLGACIITAALLAAVAAGAAAFRRPALVAWGAHGALLWGLSFASAGSHTYAQAFAAPLLWTTILVAWLESREREEQPWTARLEAVAGGGTLVALLALLALGSSPMFSTEAFTESRRVLLDALPPGATVLLPYPYHPITADDASYWGALLLTDSPGRLCNTVEAYRERYPDAAVKLPRCSILDDLRRARPAVVTRDLPIIGPPADYFATKALIEQAYQSTDALANAPTPTFGSYVVFRK